MISRRFRPTFHPVALLALLFALVSGPATADTVYTYVGNPFDTAFGTGCPPNCRISGWFSVAAPLAPNLPLTQVTPTAFSFTDGVLTFDNSTTVASFTFIGVITDADGNIVEWNNQFKIAFDDGTAAFMFSGTNPPGCAGCSVTDQSGTPNYFVSVNNDAGLWSTSTPPGPQPTVNFLWLSKLAEYVQTSDAPPIPNPMPPGPAYGGPFGFNVEIGGTNLSGIVPPTITVPAGSGILQLSTYNRGVLGWNAQAQKWEFGWPNFNNFGAPTQARIDDLFHSGAYTFRILGENVTLDLAPPPVVSQAPWFTLTGGTWSNGQYVVNVHHPLTITSNTFDGYSAGQLGGTMRLNVRPNGPGDPVASTSHSYAQEPDVNHLTMTIPPCALVSGQEYGAHGAFVSLVASTGVASAFHELDTALDIVATGGGCVTFDIVEEAVRALGFDAGSQQALLASLQAASAAATRGNLNAAQGQIGAFINKVQALAKSRRLSSDAAAALIAQAQLLL